MNYHLVASEIKHGECEYEQLYLLKVEGELPDDADYQLTSWNWGWCEDFDPDDDGWLDLCERWVRDYVKQPVSEDQYSVLSEYLPTIPFNFNDRKPIELRGEG